ncbi:MAG: hypothetical protein E4H37_04280 [Gemmatimonadales bacterium]|nr:MAG: hypothetical protein E4H37_04280 [Gemmatimonadales bacterium]
MVERSVQSGRLGCPVCGKTYAIADGVARFDAPPSVDETDSVLTTTALEALVGLSGPGGYAALVGVADALCRGLADRLDGVHLASINPPDHSREIPSISVLEGTSIPLKSRSVRAVVLASAYADEPHWLAEAKRVVLPGLRVVGEGPVPTVGGLEVIASAGGVWVGLPT